MKLRIPGLPERFLPYENRIIATVLGFIIGVLLLTIGFWKTLLLAIVTVIGFVIGSYRDGTFQSLVARFMGLFNRS